MEVRQSVAIQHDLSLGVIAGDDVADRPQGRRLDLNLLVAEQWDEFRHHAAVDHLLDLIIASIRQVAYGPCRVDQYLQQGLLTVKTSNYCVGDKHLFQNFEM